MDLILFLSSVHAGFPSPADDHVDTKIDLNEQLILRPSATFLLRVEGHSMEGAGIFDGDVLIVDRSLRPVDRSVVVVALDGEVVVRRLIIQRGRHLLYAEAEGYPAIDLAHVGDARVWGIARYCIHKL